MSNDLSSYKFDYVVAPINEIKIEEEINAKTGRRKVTGIIVQDERHESSDRFWTSLFARYGFSNQFFNFYTHKEVFDRVAEKSANDRVRLCVERNSENGSSTVRGASLPTKPVVGFDDLVDLLTRYQGEGITYHDGIVESIHTPRTGNNNFDISGDVFSNRFQLATPIDGYGQPNIYLSMLRQVCSNGLIGLSKAFKSNIGLGKGGDDVAPAIIRALDGFGNDEGYAALRQRIESATTSWASVHETNDLYRLLVKLHAGKNIGVDEPSLKRGNKLHRWATSTPDGRAQSSMGEEQDVIGSPVIKAFHTMTGDTSHLYGLANLDALSVKRQRTLPTKATVYDAINFATEVATHYSNAQGSRSLNAWVGSLLSDDEYDMEGTMQKFGDFEDFFIQAKLGAKELTGSK